MKKIFGALFYLLMSWFFYALAGLIIVCGGEGLSYIVIAGLCAVSGTGCVCLAVVSED